MGKLVRGIGINDSDEQVFKRGDDGKMIWRCPYYSAWSGILTRATKQHYASISPCYIGVTVVKEWLTFSVFKKWMMEQEWEGKSPDKDIIKEGNKEYGPKNCRYVTQFTNSVLSNNGRKRTKDLDLPRGITRYDHGGYHYITAVGRYDTPYFKREKFVELGDALKFYKENKKVLMLSCLELESDPEIRKGILREANKY